MEEKIDNFKLVGEIGSFVCYYDLSWGINRLSILKLFEIMKRKGYKFIFRSDNNFYFEKIK